jgi:hypothetical protein
MQVEPQQMPNPLTAAQVSPDWALAQSSVTHALPKQLSPVGHSPVVHALGPPSVTQVRSLQNRPLGQMIP